MVVDYPGNKAANHIYNKKQLFKRKGNILPFIMKNAILLLKDQIPLAVKRKDLCHGDDHPIEDLVLEESHMLELSLWSLL